MNKFRLLLFIISFPVVSFLSSLCINSEENNFLTTHEICQCEVFLKFTEF